LYHPNIYVAPSDKPPGYRTVPISASHPKMQSAWHVFDPVVMYRAPRQVRSLQGNVFEAVH
jgi:beta-glucosidase